MNMDETIKRINELYKKSQNEGLNAAEKEEQKKLRQVYIDSIRGSLKSQLDNVDIKEADGSVISLGEEIRRKKEENEKAAGNIKAEKALLRKEMLAKRDAILKEERFNKSLIIKDKLFTIEAVAKAKYVLLYASYNSEVSTFAIMDELKKRGIHTAFPKCTITDGIPGLEFYEVSKFSQLSSGYKGILEPDTIKYNLKKITSNADVIIVPGISFDSLGRRLGYGKGFYDRFLSKVKIPRIIGIAFSEQMAERVPTEATDHKMDIVVTDTEILTC